MSLFGSYRRYVHYLFESRIEMEVPKTAKSENWQRQTSSLTQFFVFIEFRANEPSPRIDRAIIALNAQESSSRSQLQIREPV